MRRFASASRTITRVPDVRRVLAAALVAWAGAAFGADSIFLVSRKDMPDPNFHDAVVLVTPVEGAPVGVILNRPTGIPLATLLPDVEKNTRPGEKLYFGGPVSRQMVTFLFKAPKRPPDTIEVLDGVYFASSRKLLVDILTGETPVDELRVFAGYAGWTPEQLEGEVSRGDWHVQRSDAKTIFEKNAEKVWPELDRRASRTPVRFDQERR